MEEKIIRFAKPATEYKHGKTTVTFPHPVDGVKLIASEEIKRYYDAKGEVVPFQWVICSYVEIDGIYYACIPLVE